MKDSIFLTNGDETASGVVEVYPIRLAFEEDVATPFEYDPFNPREDRLDCHQWGYDGYKDLTLKFDTQEVVSAFGLSAEDDPSSQEWFLIFKLTDGNELIGSDVVWILNRTKKGNNGNHYGRIRHKDY